MDDNIAKILGSNENEALITICLFNLPSINDHSYVVGTDINSDFAVLLLRSSLSSLIPSKHLHLKKHILSFLDPVTQNLLTS